FGLEHFRLGGGRRRRGAGGSISAATDSDLARQAGEEAVGLRVRRRVGDPRRRRRGRHGRELGFFRRTEQEIVGRRGARRVDVGGNGAGGAGQSEQRQALAVAAFGEA